MKKLLLLLCTAFLMLSCANSQEKLNQGNKEQVLEDVKSFYEKPLLTEKGEEIPIDNFKPKGTKDFQLHYNGIVLNAPIDPSEIPLFLYVIELKDPNMNLEYVKVEKVSPNNVKTFIDETLEGKTTKRNILNGAKVTTRTNVVNGIRYWNGKVVNMPKAVFSAEGNMYRYLFKFTLKPVNKPETIIYQPTFLQVAIGN